MRGRISLAIGLALLSFPLSTVVARAAMPGEWCGFSFDTLRFQGSDMEQALCLLRPSLGQGERGPKITTLPKPFDELVGRSTTPAVGLLREYLKQLEIPEDAVGGNLDGAVIGSDVGDSQKPKVIPAAYFVIHDTSSPDKIPPGKMPADINSKSWKYNDIWDEEVYDVNKFPLQVNLIIGRLGSSRTLNDFGKRRVKAATALESSKPNYGFTVEQMSRAKGVFLHVENVMPRQLGPACPVKDGCYGPNPTLTDAQYERLALVYIAASVRAKRWLIPAYHVNIHNDHDDPLGFDLAKWAGIIARHLAGISKN